MGRWPGHRHAGAPPAYIRLGVPVYTQLQKGSATSRACVLAWRSGCSGVRGISISPWKRGTLARSPTWRCAAARVGVLGFCARSCHTPCACAGAAQYMFYYANSFNQPVAAWDVGKVTNMEVRRCPRLGRVLLRIQLPRGVARAVRVC